MIGSFGAISSSGPGAAGVGREPWRSRRPRRFGGGRLSQYHSSNCVGEHCHASVVPGERSEIVTERSQSDADRGWTVLWTVASSSSESAFQLDLLAQPAAEAADSHLDVVGAAIEAMLHARWMRVRSGWKATATISVEIVTASALDCPVTLARDRSQERNPAEVQRRRGVAVRSGVDERPPDDHVDLVQPVAQHTEADRDRNQGK